MKTPENLSPALHKAFEIYIAELKTHFAELEKTLTTINDSSLSDEQLFEYIFSTNRDLLANRFHVIKGGAGFLHLDEVYESVRDAEDLFKAPPEDSSQITAIKETISQALVACKNTINEYDCD